MNLKENLHIFLLLFLSKDGKDGISLKLIQGLTIQILGKKSG